jgi:anthranilate phosphoribosyltransferase
MSNPWRSDILKSLLAGANLSVEQARGLFDQIMAGELSESQIAAVLVALAAKGETVEEITGAALAMRSHARKINPGGLEIIDTCGTGGTGLCTFNISTAAALVAAGAGAKVAKHGNRTGTRPSGSADVLAALGVNIDCEAEAEARCLQQAGVCFCFAVRHHPAMKFAAPVRRALGVRTVFNVLGPLTNPAGATRQLMGVFDDKLVEPIAAVLAALGATRAMVVHAADGLDEISTTSPTHVADLRAGKITIATVTPEQFGLTRARMEDLLVTTAEESAQCVREVLAGKPGPRRDIVVLNAAAALTVAGVAADIPAGLPLAQQSLDSGQAAKTLTKLVVASNEQ